MSKVEFIINLKGFDICYYMNGNIISISVDNITLNIETTDRHNYDLIFSFIYKLINEV